MTLELNNFIIEYDKEIDYIDIIISTLENKVKDILEFFELDKLSKKKRVVIYTDREKYKEYLTPYVGTFREWMCADTYDGNINLLEINEARKCEEHKDMTIDEFTKCILHEFVHACQQEINSNSNGTAWFWEALATNLSGQDYNIIDLSKCDFELLQKNFNGTPNGYYYAYTLGKYMLENYSKDRLINYIKNPRLLREEATLIFEEVKESQNNNLLK